MKKAFICFALSVALMSFLNVVSGEEPNESNLELISILYQEENTILQKEQEVQPEKIYVEAQDVSIFNGQIFAYLNGWWELVAGLHTDEAGLYVLAKGYHPNCPPNFQKPVCRNVHPAVYEVYTPQGEFYKFLCERHGCDYQYHTYIKKFLPPGYYVTGVKSGKK